MKNRTSAHSVTPKYFPKHLILKSESPSFTTMKNNRSDRSLVMLTCFALAVATSTADYIEQLIDEVVGRLEKFRKMGVFRSLHCVRLNAQNI
ncbi:hypothetical protein ANN_22725 [Periplaneta americana]|uniref:Uncharacterized protein n=1 Tax=Periplaneta americana TaxID=6978 RepID=A0ABQ8SKC5_PERAM|nr:hypothetical protein ANN_22725 [Periplaneta americana]